MLDFSNLSGNDHFQQPGRAPELEPMTPQQIAQKAQELLAIGLAPSMERAIQLLAVGGVMTASQIGLSPSTFRKHRKTRVVDRLPFTAKTVVGLLSSYGLPIPLQQERAMLYALGPVGEQIVKMRNIPKPPTGYFAYSLERIMHDIVLNEVILNIVNLATAQGWTPVWISEGEAALYHENQQIIKPDAMLRLKQDGAEHVFLIEYHNEDHSSRAVDKVGRYERIAARKEIWTQAWQVETFPPILAVARHQIVGNGYLETVKAREIKRCTFYGRILSSTLQDATEWFNFESQEREKIWPWAQAEVKRSETL